MSYKSNKYRPEVQAKKAWLRQHPEYAARMELHRKARGKKKERVGWWNHEWALAGYPTGGPNFDEWWASDASAKRKQHEADMAEANKRCVEAHAKWVAAGMPSGDA